MRRILRLEFSFERDTAFVRKFDGIAEQIQKHLPHPLVIQIQQRKIAGINQPENQIFFLRLLHENRLHFGTQGGKIHFFRNDSDLSRLNLGKIQDIIDQTKESRSRKMD